MPHPAQLFIADSTVTYVDFLAVFVLPPIVGLSLVTAVAPAKRARFRPWGVAVIAVVAILYTAPWDQSLIARGVWEYGPGTVAAFLGRVPVEEYLFILLQPILTALWLAQLQGADVSMGLSRPVRARIGGVLAGAAVGVAGGAALSGASTLYLGAILLWAAPVLALQWGFGWQYLWGLRRRVALAVLGPTLYLSTVDRIAIDAGIWTLSERYTTGIAPLGLPIEEAVFFLTTNLFVVQGLVLFDWVVHRWR